MGSTKIKKVAILGATGMLGSGIYRALKDVYELTLVSRNKNKLDLLEKALGNVSKHKTILYDLCEIKKDFTAGFQNTGIAPHLEELEENMGDVDAVINCAGLIKPHSLENVETTLFINSALPHILSWKYKDKLIQITTDCVYNGITGAPYDENSPKTPVDLYGLSKSVGEPGDSLVLRTSIIGPELTNHVSFLDWFKSQKGKEVNGFTNHLWNGITTLEFGNICKKIIDNRLSFPQKGLYHVYSDTHTKYEMVKMFKEKYKIDCNITPIESPTAINRTLSTTHKLNSGLNIPKLKDMLEEL